ncbi:MAG: hypothetical protein QG560_339 [Campylobacterota bacterium]|nr:hypothetical protein [Campylobacterota bacterium]MDQ1337135.1 hypothetical protein [Campylobacterota bacterium]
MISKLFESLYTKVFINIVVENLQTVVYVEVCSSKSVLQSMHKYFDTTTMNSKMYEFINAYYKESPFCYISVLDKSPLQGAIPTCNANEMSKYCDVNSSEYRCFSKDWAFYTSEYDLEALKHEYRSIGVDFIFSPFVIMANFFKDKIESTLAMFLLLEDNYISFSVFGNSKLLYSQYLSMNHHKENDELLMESSLDDGDEEISLGIDGIDLEEIDIENDSAGFDDFTNIEDLDDTDSIDEFSQVHEIREISTKEEQHASAEGFNEDYQRFSLIQSALSTFYKDPKYNSQFVENIYIADGVGVSGDLKNYLEEEMFLNVFIRKIDLGAALCDMAKAEI